MVRRLTGATAAICAVALCSSAPAAATPAAKAAPPAVDVEVEAGGFARERGISIEEARRRLGWQALAPELDERVRADLAGRFGGVWIEAADGDRLKVGVVGRPGTEAHLAVRRAADAVGLTEGYEVVAVRHAMSTLEGDNTWLGSEIARVNAGAPTHLTAGLRTDLNAVELQLPATGKLTPSQRALVDEAGRRMADRLIVGSYAGRFEPDACAYPYCDPPLRGGIRITNSGAGCTGGLVARSKVDAKLYQFTAGHCADDGATDDWSTRITDNTTHVIGPVWHWQWNSAKGDMAILRIENVVGWNPRAWVMVTDGPDTTADASYHISSDSTSVVGMRICITGASSGQSDCGSVTHLGVTATYGGVTVHNLGRGSYCRAPGDSGAPMYSFHTAYGIHVAGSGCSGLYQGIRAAESTLNVDVLHANA